VATPAIVRRRYGKGRVVVMAGSPDANVARLGSEDHARSLVDAVRWAAGAEPLVRVEGPTGMRVIVGWKASELVVHLVTAVPDLPVRHGSDRTQETISRVTPVCDVRLHVALPVVAATREPTGEALAFQQAAGAAVVVLERATDWETIRIIPA
jgi:hypothetical protein